MQAITRDPSHGHENTYFHCTGDAITHTNYEEFDRTTSLFYLIKGNVPQHINVKASYSYVGSNSFLTLQQQLSTCSAPGVYQFRGAPDLPFIKKLTDTSLLISDDGEAELLELKQDYLPMSKNTSAAANYPNIAGQVVAGLHFLTVAKMLKSTATNKGVPNQVKSRGLLVKRKDAMFLYTLTQHWPGICRGDNSRPIHF